MREAEMLERLEIVMKRRKEIEATFGPPPWPPFKGLDDPEYTALLWESINLKAALGTGLSSRGRKGGKKGKAKK
jgi:hypothetical protein